MAKKSEYTELIKKGVTLYRSDSTGRPRSWEVRVEKTSNGFDIVTLAGLIDGEKVEARVPITEGKNIGKKNETSPEEQATAEAVSRIKAKLKEGYTNDIDNAGTKGVKGSGIPSPMLAQTYDPAEKQSGSKGLKRLGLVGKPVAAQPKLDGVRRLININPQGVTMWTRSGDKSDTLPHIAKEVFDTYTRLGLTQDVWLDGEAYTAELTFNRINGLTRKESKKSKDLEDLNLIKFHCYDTIMDAGYKTRNAFIQQFKSPLVEIVETTFLNADEAELQKMLIDKIDKGFEGLIVRTLETGYESKRSNQLLKYKTFEDAEFKVVGFMESTTPGVIGAMWVEMDIPAEDENGDPILMFKATPKCSLDEKKEIWKNQKSWLGEMVTVNFFGRSEYGVPRFGRVKDKRFDLK